VGGAAVVKRGFDLPRTFMSLSLLQKHKQSMEIKMRQLTMIKFRKTEVVSFV
jgi:hypothetical protein